MFIGLMGKVEWFHDEDKESLTKNRVLMLSESLLASYMLSIVRELANLHTVHILVVMPTSVQ